MIKICTASAGAGKTHKLTSEYISLLLKDTNAYKHILAVTFTNKATEEMKQRILEELYNLSVKGRKSEHLDDIKKSTLLDEDKIREESKKVLINILHDYSSFSISTIDRFFQLVMRSFAKELGRMATYDVELDTDTVITASIDKMFAQLEDPQNKDLLNWLINYSLDQVDSGSSWNVKGKIKALCKEIFSENFKLISNKCKADYSVKEVGELKSHLLRVADELEKDFKRCIADGIKCMSANNVTPADFKNGSRSPFTYFTKAYESKGILVPTPSFLKLAGNSDGWCTKTNTSMVNAIFPQLNPIVEEVCEFFGPDGGFNSYTTAKAILDNINILGILSELYSRILEYCKEKNLILISESTELLNKIIDGSDTPFIYEKIGTTIDNFMLDEFQDTSTMQWNNFYPLIANSLDSGNDNLIVGDVKQSIYRWRGSDWDILANRIKQQFSPKQIVDDPLKENWRSGKEIIEFNNNFFKFCALQAQEKYSSVQKSEIVDLYSAPGQLLPKKKGNAKGYVKIEFIPNDAEDFAEEVMLKLKPQIEELRGRGYSLSDIGILVRKNSEGAQVANYLIENGYAVISGDSLFISSSNSVMAVVNILREMDNPDSAILGVYRKYMDIPSMSNDKGDSLYQLCESIIREALTENQKEDIAYLQAFLDLVLAYTLKEGTNISQFIKWWDEVGVGKTISAPEDADAIKIMTIHKSKGLAFKVTIIPFLNEQLDHNSLNAPILWNEFAYSTDGTTTKNIAVPVKYSSKLEATSFAESYLKEKLCSYIDAINTVYVAFTRAKNELVIFAKAPKFKQDGTYSISGVADILYKYCEKTLKENVCEYGEPIPVSQEAKVKEKFLISDAFMCNKHTDIMKNALGSGNIKEGENIREYGIAMHYVFSLINTSKDIQQAVRNAVDSAVADCSFNDLLSIVNKAMDCVKRYDWFDENNTVFNECSIIQPDGNIKRPDRVIVQNGCATVIDYKFGEFNADSMQLKGYKRQVANYKDLLLKIGYKNVKGYIWYPLDNQIIEV